MYVRMTLVVFAGLFIHHQAEAASFSAPTTDLGANNGLVRYICKSRISATAGGKYYPGHADQNRYMYLARKGWVRNVRNRHGGNFTSWSLARQQRGACSRSAANRTQPETMTCSVAATPCRLTN